jgi:hypothetical protein
MVDPAARKALGLSLRRLFSARITNEQFEDELPSTVWSSPDAAVRAIRWAAWLLYDDLHEHRLDGAHALGPLGRRHVARWILFLKSDEEYEWPEIPWWLGALLLVPSLLTFGLAGRALSRWRDRAGDRDVWPFMRRSELERAIAAWPRDRGG